MNMDLSEGMVAVVRGIQEAALCVTLLDGTRQYTLMPNAVPTYVQSTQKTEITHHATDCQGRINCESSVQAVDGRYASIYKMAHCNVTPTSPPVTLTEFPPQRAELCHGHGNFEVGGVGSGENTHSPTRNNGPYRGGMSWPDRGSVCSPRPSHEPDAFANSLRKYPSMSPDRSTEIVERLVNYTQMKNTKNLKSHSQTSDCSSQNCSRRFEPEVTVRCKSPEESPTRDKKSEEWECRRVYGRSYDVRYVRETKKAKDLRNISTYPYSHPVCPTIKERYDHLPPEQKHHAELNVSHSVNMETQADIPMVSREVTTLPRVPPSTRNVAVPLSPSSSNSDTKPERSNKAHYSSKSIQTAKAVDMTPKPRKSAQTCFSSIDLIETKKVKNKRKSKSQEELRVSDDFEEEIVQLIEDLTSCPDLDRENIVRSKLLRKLRKAHKVDRHERIKIKIGRCIKDQLYSEIDLKNFTKELSNEVISKIKRHNIFISNPTSVYRADLHSLRSNHEENCVDEIIKEWLNDIPIKSTDYLGREVKKGHLLQTVANKVRNLIINKLKYNSDSTMKADIIEIIEDIPIDVSGHNKRFYLNRLVSELMRKIKNIFTPSHSKRRWRKTSAYPCKYIQPTEKELKQFVREEISEFTGKFSLKVCPETLKHIETELASILMDSLEIIRLGNVEDVKEDILGMLAEFVSISEHQAIYFSNNVIYNLKDIFDQSNCINKPRSQTFIVLPNSFQNNSETSKNKTEFSIEGISEGDLEANLDFYTNQVVQQIKKWSANVKAFDEIDPGFRQVVINDLAGDIVDRHKYLELNTSSQNTDADELEHLKYQIFKWINKISREDNLDTIEHASELMDRIRSLPVPMLTKPLQNRKANQPLCCQHANDMVPDTKPEAIQSTSRGRRFSSPDQFTSQKYESSKNDQIEQAGSTMIITGKKFMNQNRRQSSPDGLSIPEVSCCKNASFPQPDGSGSPQDVTTESRFNASMGVTSTPKENAPTSNMAQNRILQPQGPSVSMTEPPRDRPPAFNRRMGISISGPGGFSSGPMSQRSEVKNKSPQSTSRLGSPSRSNKVNCCTNTPSKEAQVIEPPSVKQLNDEYDEFVKNWVQEIPIVTSSPEEQTLADKARLGIYNGVWKAITKLKMCPESLSNPFYYQDVFDDELEELLICLPQTPELAKKKHKLKAQLIEKTTNTNEMIVSAAGPSTYKQQLVENVANNLPRNKINYSGKDLAKLYEEMLMMNLAENFILYTQYREVDKVKANVFKKKLMKEVQELINGVKANHGKNLQDIDVAAYIDEVIAALQKVPLPSEDTLREEADEINIGLEIDQWFSDLPLLPNDDVTEKLGRRRYKDALAKKIHEIEKINDQSDYDAQTKEEVRRFLERMPLRPGEKENIDFMVEELVNRLKNRTNDIVAIGGERKKSVTFMEGYDYDDFSRDMPVCSSFSDFGQPAQANRSSYMIADGTRVKDGDPYGQYVHKRDVTPESQQQWYTLEETEAPPAFKSPVEDRQGTLPPCYQAQRQTSIPRDETSGPLPITYNSSSQTPIPALSIQDPESPRACNMPNQSMFDGSRRYDQSHERSKPCSQRFEQDPQPFESTSQQFEQDPQRSEPRRQRFEQSPQRFEQSPQQFEPYSQQFEQGSQRFEPCSQRYDQEPQQFDQAPQMSRFDPETADHGTGTSPTCDASCKSRRSSAPPSYKTEGTPRHMTQSPNFKSRQYNSPKTTIPSAHFCSDPIGFSTPQQNTPPAASKPRKKTKEVEKQRREAARKRLDLEDTENESEEEVRCRCMEKIWKCRRRKPICPTCDESDFMPCFMRFPPHPYFF